ncbi:hypothetical protein F4810DRAFT_416062 [Camillea tinctor]|nr:hypothetical protein F4810DRAFT_416062 [Camillea tinctor]
METHTPAHLIYDIPPNGLTVIVSPTEPTLDVVFIHGFTGHPERTWSQKNGRVIGQEQDEEPPAKIRKINPFSRSHENRSNLRTSVYWPRDLLPDTLPNARVLTYGYDTRIKHAFGPLPNTNTVYDIGWDLLVALEGERRGSCARPIIFIVHSLGGIIVKEMLRRSDGCKSGQIHLHDICNSTRAVVFFGTPHSGADPRGLLLKALEKVVKAVGFSVNQQLVDTLLPSSERLRELRDHFAPMAREHNWIVHSFQENIGLKALNGDKVVNDTSSCLSSPDIEVTQHIDRNHMDMCRFSDATDVEYRKVVNAITRIHTNISNPPTSEKIGQAECRDTTQHASAISPDQCTELLASLRFDQIDARHATIKRAHAKTCEWFLTQPSYFNWLDPNRYDQHNGLLWIKGNPGTGKSTLMKYLLGQAQRAKGLLTLSFFFNARGEMLEKSTCGMYQSLLLQLLEKDRSLQPICCRKVTSHLYSNNEWDLEVLQDLLDIAITNHSGPLRLFIDALDECDETEVREMLSFFNQLGETVSGSELKLFVCFSSRHYPHIRIGKGIQLILEREDGHSHDIASYLSSELHIGHSKLAETVRTEILQKASGIFMWILIVVQILNKEYDHGQVHVLRKKLQDIPGDLHRLFETILERDERNRGQLLACIQFLLLARRSLSREELYHAIIASTDMEALTSVDTDYITPDVMNRFILSASKGLAEVTRSQQPTVQFIHESVRDFLLKHCNIAKLWSEYNTKFPERSHGKIASYCLGYLEIDIMSSITIPSPIHQASSNEGKQLREALKSKFPFLEYAVQNVLYHANLAQAGGICQKAFLQSFPTTRWVLIDNLLAQYDTRRHKQPSLCYLLAEADAANLIHLDDSYDPGNPDVNERYRQPLLAAIAYNNVESIKALLQIHFPSNNARILQNQRSQREKHIGTNVQLRVQANKSILHYLVQYGDSRFVDYVLSTIQQNGTQVYALFDQAVRQYKTDVVWLLLEKYHGVYLDHESIVTAVREVIRDGRYDIFEALWHCAPSSIITSMQVKELLIAVEHHCSTIMKIMLKYDGFEAMELKGIVFFRRCLIASLHTPSLKCTKFILGKIAELYGCDSFFGEFDIHQAISVTRSSTYGLELILDSIKSESLVGKFLLHLSSVRGYLTVIRKLIKKGVPVDEKDDSQQTALQTIIWKLVERGVSVDEKDDSQQRTLKTVRTKILRHMPVEIDSWIDSNYSVVDILLRNGADPNVLWPSDLCSDYIFGGESLVHTAVRLINPELLRLFVRDRASSDVRNSRGMTPGELAMELGYFDMWGYTP